MGAVFYIDQKQQYDEIIERLKSLVDQLKDLSEEDFELFRVWLKNVVKISDGIKRVIQGNDELETGPNKGKSKLATSLKETFLPGLFNEWIDGDFDSFGYKKQAEKEYNPNEVMDPWFKSDYAIDRKEAKTERKKAKEDLQEYWEEEFKYEEINENDKLIIDPIIEKLIREELNATHPLDIRGNYDENQERIE